MRLGDYQLYNNNLLTNYNLLTICYVMPNFVAILMI
jgi:hypothetical protein